VKVPIAWLRECVDFDATPGALAEALTMSGMEVEGIVAEKRAPDGVVAARIVAVTPHPDADRLRLCRVDDGRGEVEVVCGADNAAPGVTAPLARPGASLADGTVVRESAIRGRASAGMLCAEDELGLSDDHSGIMILPDGVRPGTPLAEVLGPPDTVLEVEVTWNRPDCLSIMGVAREVGAIFRRPVRRPDVSFAEEGGPAAALAAVRVEDPAGCPRYTARVLTGVRVAPSPWWLRRRLLQCGVRPINNVVDVTNYVLLECGHPLHAFDRERLEGRAVVVRRGRPGEIMATIDGARRKVEGLLVIADAAGPVAVAGVMGGMKSEIRPATSAVLIESARFHPPAIRAASSALGLSTESSYRFERGVDGEGVDWASRRAAALMLRTAGGSAARGVIDLYAGPPAPRRVTCRFARVRSLLGMEVPADEIVDILSALGMGVAGRTAAACEVVAPGYRPDIELEADLIEEVARLHGLDRVPAPMPACRVAPGGPDEQEARALDGLRADLAALGLSEIMNYSFVSADLLKTVPAGDPATRVELPNPVNRDQSVLRDSLLPQMAATVGRNVSRQSCDLGLFEIGRTFARKADGTTAEKTRVALGLLGRPARIGMPGRGAATGEETFLELKGLIEGLCVCRRLGPLQVESVAFPALEDGWAVALRAAGAVIGMAGLLREDIAREWRLPGPAGLAELDVAALLAGAFDVPVCRPVPLYPAVARDIALVVDESVTHARVLEAIAAGAPKELTQACLFDTFRSEGIGKDKKSLAYSLVYRAMDRTLTDEDANAYHEAVKNVLRKKLNAQIREG